MGSNVALPEQVMGSNVALPESRKWTVMWLYQRAGNGQ